jgi:hypothetical protein
VYVIIGGSKSRKPGCVVRLPLFSAKFTRLTKYNIRENEEEALLFAKWGKFELEDRVDEAAKLRKNAEDTCLWLGEYQRFTSVEVAS